MSLFDYLNDELLDNVLYYFQYDEIVILRYVNRRFRNLVDNCIENQVVWFKRSDKEMQFHVLFDLDEEKFVFNCLASYSLTTFRNTTVHHLIRQLITFNPFIVLNLEFANLHHLEIINPSFKRHPEMIQPFVNLNLAKLQRLKIDLNKKPLTFYLNCKRLRSLYFNGSVEHFNVCYPDQLTSLTCSTVAGLKSFRNVRNLRFLEFDTYHNCHYYLLDELRMLEKVEIQNADRKSLEKLRKEKIELRRPNPRCYYNGFDIEMEKFNFELFYSFSNASVNQNQIELFTGHLDCLSDTLHQTKLLHKVDLENVPYELLLKFDYLDEIKLSISLTDTERWQRILLLYRLSALKIKVPLSQQYLDLIPNHQATIRCLKISQCEDLSFVLRLIYLRELHTRQFFDRWLFKQMLENLGYLETVHILKYFHFSLDDHSIACSLEKRLTFKESRRLFLTIIIHRITGLEQMFKPNILCT